ncbi:MAG: carboxypeptidase-like regulatory domain-containing protein [Acidobacteriota bacterium]|nr:carboxypeptidase-like regulatory domain-containing protein [Acidobacteriota bacterium]
MRRLFAGGLMIVALLLGGAGAGHAQSLTGQLTGTVTDEKGAVIPNATVEMKNEASGDVRRTVSNDEGFFSFAAVQAATYVVTIDSSGFAKYQQTGLVFNIGDKVNLRDIALRPGGVGEQVTVTASQNQIVPVDTGDKAALISAEQIQNISVVGRSAAELIKILPGFVPTTGLNNQAANTGEVMGINGNGDAGKQSAIGNYSANGGRTDQVDIVSDGAHVSDPGCNCATPVNPNTDMVQEFKVLQSNFGAENSKGPVVLNSVSKAGGNEFHGTGYIYMRDSKLNANEWGANKLGSRPDGTPVAPRPKNRFMFPGGNLGGPVLIPGTGFNKNRDKLFFFTGYEYYYQKLDTGVIRSVVPTEAMRNGDFTDTAYLSALNTGAGDTRSAPCSGTPPLPAFCAGVNRIAPSAFDPGGRVLTSLLPLPNIDPRSSSSNGYNYAQVIEFKQPSYQFLTRVDYSISDNTKLFARYNRQREEQPFPVGLWWRNGGQVPYPSRVIGKNESDSYSATLTHVFGPTLTNEVVFGHTIIKFPNVFEDPSKVTRSALSYPYRGIFKNGVDQIPSFTGWSQAATVFNPGGFFDPGGNRGLFADKYLTSIADNVTKVAGTHTLKFGFYFENVINNQPGNGNSNGVLAFANWHGKSTGNYFSDILTGRAAQYAEQTANVLHNIGYQTYEGYVSDSWKATPKLTLEFGARLARLGNWYDREGNGFAVFDRTKFDPTRPISELSGVSWHGKDPSIPNSGQEQKALQVMPRLGFAYDIFGEGKTVLRGGYGQFTFHEAQLTTGIDLASGVRSVTLNSVTLAEIDATSSASPDVISNIDAFDPTDTKKPLTHSFSFTVQQRLPGQMTLETSYVGNRSRNLLNSGISNINIIPFGTIPFGQENDNDFRPFKPYGNINLVNHSFFQNYDSLQMLLSRQTGRVSFMGAYTFSKARGVRGGGQGASSDNLRLRENNYGVLGYDRTHVFSIAYSLLLPDIGKNYLGDNMLTRALFDGWQFSGITALSSGAALQPNSPNGPNFGIRGTNSLGQALNNARNIVGTPDTSVQPILTCDPRKGTSENQYANPNCFAAPLRGQVGNYIFPYLKGPAFQNHDLSLFKNINFSEDKKFQFRISGYNFLNRPLKSLTAENLILEYNNGQLTPDTLNKFGRYTENKFGRRIIQLAFKFYF